MVRTYIKRLVMWLYCRDLISGAMLLRVFEKFDLWNA